RAGSENPDVKIAADAPRGHHCMKSRFRQGTAYGAGEGPQWPPAVLAAERRLQRGRVILPGVERGFLEVVRQQPETRDVGRPSEAGRLERFDGDLQRVARLRTLDIDRSGDRVDLCEVERADVGDGALGRQLTARRVNALELDG